MKPIPPWLIADNGVRNPKRLKDGLRVLVNSEFHGDFSKKNEEGMALLLEREGVISLQTNTDNTISRKWRLNLIRLGFISEKTHTVTENGRRLINASSLPEEENCFLRALLAHQLPSSVHPFADRKTPIFSPLRMVLEIINELKERGEIPRITLEELASIVILEHDMNKINDIVDKIIHYRNLRKQAPNKRSFDIEFRKKSAERQGTVKETTLRDYADVNMRYLKLTGLFAEDGMSLSIALHKKTLVDLILSRPFVPTPDAEYEKLLTTGASLPTDDKNEAIVEIKNLYRLLIDNGEDVENLPDLHSISERDLEQLSIKLENDWLHVMEKKFAAKQVDEWEDIVSYLRDLQKPRTSKLIPSGEAPVYFEWIIWRAFLAINDLRNRPWEARRFTVDRSFLPVRHAPGGGPDMIFEFDDFVLVTEVTLTSSSRQEAAEGEPVRRHVAEYVDEYIEKGKRVFGLFIANNIDTNTAETFRIGVWYREDDSQMALHIIPMTLADFTDLFEAIFKNDRISEAKDIIKLLLMELRVYSNQPAPEWKAKISEEIQRNVDRINSRT